MIPLVSYAAYVLVLISVARHDARAARRKSYLRLQLAMCLLALWQLGAIGPTWVPLKF